MRFLRRRRDEPVQEIAERWRATLEAASAAELEGKARRHDRLVARAVSDARVLLATDAGRAAVEACLSDPEPAVRAVAASYALAWDPETARPILEALLADDAVPGTVKADTHLALARFDSGLT